MKTQGERYMDSYGFLTMYADLERERVTLEGDYVTLDAARKICNALRNQYVADLVSNDKKVKKIHEQYLSEQRYRRGAATYLHRTTEYLRSIRECAGEALASGNLPEHLAEQFKRWIKDVDKSECLKHAPKYVINPDTQQKPASEE